MCTHWKERELDRTRYLNDLNWTVSYQNLQIPQSGRYSNPNEERQTETHRDASMKQPPGGADYTRKCTPCLGDECLCGQAPQTEDTLAEDSQGTPASSRPLPQLCTQRCSQCSAYTRRSLCSLSGAGPWRLLKAITLGKWIGWGGLLSGGGGLRQVWPEFDIWDPQPKERTHVHSSSLLHTHTHMNTRMYTHSYIHTIKR